MPSGTSVSFGKQAGNILASLVIFVVVTAFVLMAVIKGPWEWLVPELFPGAVAQGLIAPTISWGTTILLASALACLSGLLRLVRFPWQSEPSTRALDVKLNAITKHLGIDLDAAITTEIRALLTKGMKMEALALYRDYAGVSLAEAKRHVESLEGDIAAKAAV